MSTNLTGIYIQPSQTVQFPVPSQVAETKLMMQYSNSPNLVKYMMCIIKQQDELVKAIQDTINLRYLADAFGKQLDVIGEIVGQSRIIAGAAALGYFGFYDEPRSANPSIGDDATPTIGGTYRSDGDRASADFRMNDVQYRQAIYAKILKNDSRCSIDDVLTWIDLIVGYECDTEIVEGVNTGTIFIHESLSQTNRTTLGLFMAFMKPVGTGLILRDNTGVIAIRPIDRNAV